MTRMTRSTLVTAIVGSMAVAFGAGVWAQTAGKVSAHRDPPTFIMGQPAGPVISGADIGFLPVAGAPGQDGAIVGKIVVRVNGRWLEVQQPVRVMPAR